MIKNKLLLIKTMVAAAALAVAAMFFLTRPKADEETPAYGRIHADDFAKTGFIDQDHRPFDPAVMKGRRWVVNFFFTSCPGPCPIMTQKIALMMAKDPDLRALSITSDPETDTPDVMKAYAAKFKADLSRWSFVRGEQRAVREFSEKILKLPLGEMPDSHSPRVAQINESGEITGWMSLD